MKMKGVNPVEQHLEKAVVGLLLVVVLGVVAGAFLFGGSTVKVGRATDLPPGEAFVPVEAAARDLARKLATEAPELPQAPTLSLATRLGAGFGADQSIKGVHAAMGPAVKIAGMDSSKALAAALYSMPSVPAPGEVSVMSFRATIDPREVARNKALAALVPAQQPFDKAAVSIEARFDGTALRTALEHDPDGSGPIEPLPLGWWRDPLNMGQDLVQVLAVEVERETIRTADGTTPANPAKKVFSGMPGREHPFAMWQKEVKSAGDAGAMIEQVRYFAEEIQRPAYFATIAGPKWVPPSEAVDPTDAAARQRRVDALQRDLAGVDANLQRLRDMLAQVPAAGEPAGGRENEREGPRGGGGRGGRGGPSGAGGGAAAPRPTEERRPTLNRAAIERQIRDVERRRERVVKQLDELGVKVETAAAPGGQAPDQPAIEPTLPMLENGDVKIYAHDLEATPGEVYRYRVRLVINNPIYGRSVQESQKALSEPSTIASPWSDWSQMKDEVERDEYVFITAASPGGTEFQPRPTGVAQLYRYYYGYYREATVTLEPGDQLVGEAKLPDLKLADMSKLPTGVAETPGVAPLAPTAPPPPPPPGGGRGGAVAPPPRGPEGERGAPAPGAVVGEMTSEAGPEWLSIPAPKVLTLSAEAVFLDATPVPFTLQSAGGMAGTARYQAIIRGIGGALEVQRPDQVRNQDLYRRVDGSARAGTTQGQPQTRPIEPPTPLPPVPQPGRMTPPGRGGGGGGGGGGG